MRVCVCVCVRLCVCVCVCASACECVYNTSRRSSDTRRESTATSQAQNNTNYQTVLSLLSLIALHRSGAEQRFVDSFAEQRILYINSILFITPKTSSVSFSFHYFSTSFFFTFLPLQPILLLWLVAPAFSPAFSPLLLIHNVSVKPNNICMSPSMSRLSKWLGLFGKGLFGKSALFLWRLFIKPWPQLSEMTSRPTSPNQMFPCSRVTT